MSRRAIILGCGAAIAASASVLALTTAGGSTTNTGADGSAAAVTRPLPAPTPYLRYSMSATRAAIAGAPGAKGSPRASILVPREWTRLARTRDRITLRTTNTNCRFTVRISVRQVAQPPGSAVDHVTAALPAASPRHVQDSGVRGPTAWRVVKRRAPGQGIDAMQAYATSSGVTGLPAGQRAWTELRASAQPRPTDECHAGSYRAVSRQIGDAIAVSVR